ncbi:hypothetical protein AtubIFM55763_002626 [Aspergillus tubingensis]|uniref:Uncharacterized protein n=1 Tax=Aspergillus tubingensis TaxID=5068 RepID=A0A8H3T4X5_ASPTU|nr:major facilitator superfamily protein [Aspergillus tubingensis]GFN20851.1 major facilitator superfamily protein [Aspergillus tubingensis]GLA72106.1 hypothetical protein AtubIFM55763_002626 [Aspergillus tubingensis]GLA89026.1 hypothetical protein AtubIFM56815_003496 [Aspergillus tubingensis]GLA97201.1 hypothetical protein AtubIFM57143_004689 [Aspergillus tubingensis]
MRFLILTLALLSTILTLPSITLAHPALGTEHLQPRGQSTITFLSSIFNNGMRIFRLDKTVRYFTLERLDDVKSRSSEALQSLDEAIATGKSIGHFDPASSHAIAALCIPLKVVYGNMIKSIRDKREELTAAKYKDEMIKTLVALRVKSREFAELVKKILTEPDGSYCLYLEDFVDKRYAKTIDEYKGINSGDSDDVEGDIWNVED